MKKAKIKANGHSALILAATVATGLIAGLILGLAAPARAGSDGLDTPVFVAPTDGAAQSAAAQPNVAQAAPNQPAAENQATPPDQLNDSDRALHDAAPPATTASSETTAPRAAPVVAASGEHSVWDETSLIGKIFIGFGALLTVASAARMFMA